MALLIEEQDPKIEQSLQKAQEADQHMEQADNKLASAVKSARAARKKVPKTSLCDRGWPPCSRLEGPLAAHNLLLHLTHHHQLRYFPAFQHSDQCS